MADLDELVEIENAWVLHHATEQPRNATHDITRLVTAIRHERERYHCGLELKNRELEEQQNRAREFSRVALKNGNALLVAEARLREYERQLDDVLGWAARQDTSINNAVRALLNDYIEDAEKSTSAAI